MQASNTRASSHLGGSGGKFGIFNFRRVFLRPSDSSFEASFYCVRHNEKYTHLKNEGAQPPPSSKWGGGAQAPSIPPISPPMQNTFD